MVRALLHKFSRFISRLWNVIGWNSTIKVSLWPLVQSSRPGASRCSAQRRRAGCPPQGWCQHSESRAGDKLSFPTFYIIILCTVQSMRKRTLIGETDLVGVVMVFGCGNIWLRTYLDLSWAELHKSGDRAWHWLRQGQHKSFYQNNFSFSWSHP